MLGGVGGAGVVPVGHSNRSIHSIGCAAERIDGPTGVVVHPPPLAAGLGASGRNLTCVGGQDGGGLRASQGELVVEGAVKPGGGGETGALELFPDHDDGPRRKGLTRRAGRAGSPVSPKRFFDVAHIPRQRAISAQYPWCSGACNRKMRTSILPFGRVR